MLDIDGFRYDKATQSTVDAEGEFSAAMRKCAREVNKTNFFIPGEITGGNTFGAVYLGTYLNHPFNFVVILTLYFLKVVVVNQTNFSTISKQPST